MSAQRGVALLAALILMLAVVMVLGNIFYRHQIDVSHAGSAVHTDQALLLALSVESWARQRLSSRVERNGRPFNTADVDHSGETWAQAVPMLPVEGGMIRGCLQDLQAKININNFAWYGTNGATLETELSPANDAPMGTARVWHNLLELADLPVTGARSATLIDWLDADANLINSWGAEQPDYDGLRRVVANRTVTDASELAAVIGYELPEVQYLLPFITALPVTITGAPTGVIIPTKININTASESILLALGGSVGEDFVAAVLDGRGRGSHFSSVENFWSNLDQRLLLTRSQIEQRWPSTLLDVRSDFFQLYLEVLLGDIHIQVKSIIDLRGSKRKDPTILAREIVVVPKFLPAAATENQPLLSDEAADGDDQQDDLYRVQTACEVIGV
ncbi:MAG: type II secretion system minor pseudopilin GspK [Porticoccaceae bacterium]|nr:type II secretion system minor pseudopilin GspK [Porticoccaceae bacterium]